MGAFHSYGRLATPTQLLVMIAMAVAAAVLLTSYSNRAKQRGSQEGYEQARAAMAAVEKRFRDGGPADMSIAAGWKIPSPTNQVRSVSISANGIVTVQYDDSVADDEESLLQFVPVAGGGPVDLSRAENAGRKFEWQCGGPAGKSTAKPNLRPKECR